MRQYILSAEDQIQATFDGQPVMMNQELLLLLVCSMAKRAMAPMSKAVLARNLHFQPAGKHVASASTRASPVYGKIKWAGRFNSVNAFDVERMLSLDR